MPADIGGGTRRRLANLLALRLRKNANVINGLTFSPNYLWRIY
jgi:hypothetical protein